LRVVGCVCFAAQPASTNAHNMIATRLISTAYIKLGTEDARHYFSTRRVCGL
jgi:hypothetical protein